jgi:hypothetical protein
VQYRTKIYEYGLADNPQEACSSKELTELQNQLRLQKLPHWIANLPDHLLARRMVQLALMTTSPLADLKMSVVCS